MKRGLLIVCLSIAFISCKKDIKSSEGSSETTQNDSKYTSFKGQFIYYADAAVLQTKDDIYGVVINEKMHELDGLVKKFKTEDTDMVPVEVEGLLIPKLKNEEGWPYRVDIKKIVNIFKPNPNDNDIIKVGEKK